VGELNLEPVPEDPVKKRQTAAILAFVAAVALLFCGVSRRWYAADGVDAGWGPRGWSCDLEECDELRGSKSNFEIIDHVKKRYEMFGKSKDAPTIAQPIAGWITIISILLAVAGLLWGGIAALQGGIPVRPIAPSSLALLGLFFGLIAGMAFVAMNPFREKGFSGFGLSWPFWLFGAAVVTGIVAAQMLAKHKKLAPGEMIL
jgi:hypothetical protein